MALLPLPFVQLERTCYFHTVLKSFLSQGPVFDPQCAKMVPIAQKEAAINGRMFGFLEQDGVRRGKECEDAKGEI